jgi:hypothetical protein
MERHSYRVWIQNLLTEPSCVDPCHLAMARPRVAAGGDGLQIRRVAAFILNKQSLTAERGLSSLVGDWTRG